MEIPRAIHQEFKPDNIIRDSRGTLIEEGLRVAYNYQSMVKIGKILSCTSDWRVVRKSVDNKSWWGCKFSLKILNEDDHVSTVKNPNSFVII